MHSELQRPTRSLRATIALLVVCLTACVQDGVVLERSSTDGAVADSGAQDAATDQRVPDAELPDAELPDAGGVDSGPSGNVTIYLTGFEAYAGMTIRARLGALSSATATTVIQADGTAVIILNQIFTFISPTYFESYVDVDGSGSCSNLNDKLASANVTLVRDGAGYRVDLDESSTTSSLLGCLALN